MSRWMRIAVPVFLVLVGLGLPAQNSMAPASDTANVREKLIGSWHLISRDEQYADGKIQTRTDAVGVIMYTADGHMSAQVYDARRSPLGVDPESASAESVRPLYVGSAAYFGTYSVDTATHRVTHVVEGSWLPDWIGRHLERSYRFVGDDQLELSVPGFALLWQRMRV